MIKRIRQFYINVTDRMKKEDIVYAKNILSKDEQELFFALLKSEQKHSVRISKEIGQVIDNGLIENKEIISSRNMLLRVGLLHDVGKARKRLNVFDKSIIVILAKITDNKIKNIKKSKKIQCYYNHSDYSYEILKDIITDDNMLYVIKNHHRKVDDVLTKFFKEIDDRN